MVDFNNDATVTTPSWELVKILALEKRENLILALEAYYKDSEAEYATSHARAIVKVRLRVLYFEMLGWLTRLWRKDPEHEADPQALWRQIESDKFDDQLRAVSFFMCFMDKVNLTRVDTKRVYEKMNAEVENEYSQL